MSDGFSLDPRLAADTLPVGDLVLSRVLLMKDRRFPWLVLVPRRAGAVELVDLAEADQGAVLREIRAACAALRAVRGPDKLNVAALGNVVAQLHIHVIGRFRGDAAWPRPVWGAGEAEPYPPGEGEAEAARYAAALGRL
jgi:diadenosine tetraphosphate (Ap4A) HIT family hydrolase